MLAPTIFASLLAIMLLAFVVVVVESWWVVAAVGAVHLVGATMLGVFVVRRLGEEERADVEG